MGDKVWYRIWVPVRPNETRGWIREGQLALYTTSSRIVIDLSERKLYVYKRGALAEEFPVAVGKTGLSTPTGSFYITQKLIPPDPNGGLRSAAARHQRVPAQAQRLAGRRPGGHPRHQRAVAHRQGRQPRLRAHARTRTVKQVSRLVPTGSPVEIVK